MLKRIALFRDGISFKKQIIFILALVIVPFLFIIIFYTVYSMNSVMENQSAENSSEILQKSTDDLEDTLQLFENYMRATATNDADFKILKYEVGTLEAHSYVYDILQRCKNVMLSHNLDITFAVYSHENELFRQINSDYRSSYIHSSLRGSLNELTQEGSPFFRWFTSSSFDEPFLVFIAGDTCAQIACYIHLDSVVDRQYENDTVKLMLLSEELSPLAGNVQITDEVLRVPDAGENYYLTGTAPRYITVQLFSEYLGIRIFRLTPAESFWSALDPTQTVLLFASALVVLLVPLVLILIRRLLFRPLDQLVTVMDKIKGGKLDTVLKIDTSVSEYREMGVLFNEMMGQIKDLKLLSYEQALAVEQEKLQYLHMQIRPHFYLNCLKNLYGLAEQREYEKIQDLLLYLSDYLRGMFQKTNLTVPLLQELAQTQTYVRLQNMTALQKITCVIRSGNRYSDIPVPTLSVLTFVENSIKHGMVSSSRFHIDINIQQIDTQDGAYLNITITDDGRGFSDETLTFLNSGRRHMEHGVGIANVKKRFRFLYGERANLFFSNGKGACVELFIPLSDHPDTAGEEDIP